MNLSIFKNRTVIGLVCIFLSLVICFGLTPLFNSGLRARTEIVRVSSTVKKGEVLTADKLEMVKVGHITFRTTLLRVKIVQSGNM